MGKALDNECVLVVVVVVVWAQKHKSRSCFKKLYRTEG